ncbi:MAG: DUF362 domain-containing protein [Deferrisomatales bacterium]|nr:DUF362 domain-containing protein [Deferrisomatales bacterium]
MSEVFWVDTSEPGFDNSVEHKLKRLLEICSATDGLDEGARVSLKVNTSEEGYEYGLRPVFLRVAADAVRMATQRSPILCDGLKMVDYRRRTKGHAFMDVARGKGYTSDSLGGNFVINGGYSGDEGNSYPCRVPDSQLGGVEVGTAVCRTDVLWVLSHVTLNPLFGLGGALFNGGFECLAGRERERVLGGLDLYLFNGARPPAEQLAGFRARALEGTAGVVQAMGGRVLYLNYVWDVTPHPEYFPFSGEPVVPNQGFLAARDPVSLDAATLDLLTANAQRSAPLATCTQEFSATLALAEAMGLGARAYDLKRMA